MNPTTLCQLCETDIPSDQQSTMDKDLLIWTCHDCFIQLRSADAWLKHAGMKTCQQVKR